MSYCFKITILVTEMCIKTCCFYSKIAKIAQRWEFCPQTPLPLAAGGFILRLSDPGGWGFRPQTPTKAPHLQ